MSGPEERKKNTAAAEKNFCFETQGLAQWRLPRWPVATRISGRHPSRKRVSAFLRNLLRRRWPLEIERGHQA
jgi:hypothetical protein